MRSDKTLLKALKTPSLGRKAKETLRREDGFSLVELMVVVTIIGILASVAVPKFQTFRARAQQTEAKSGLNGIFLAVTGYQANHATLPNTNSKAEDANSTTAGIGFSVTGNAAKYTYRFIAGGDNAGWSAMARSKQTIAGHIDHLRINTNKWTCAPYDAVASVKADKVTNTNQLQATSTRDCPEVLDKPKTPQDPTLTGNDLPEGS